MENVITLQHEGANLVGSIFVPAGPGPHPAVMVMHTAQGTGPLTLHAARKLAELGYIALATDMFGDGVYNPTDITAITACFSPFHDPDLIRARTLAWFETLKSRPEVDPARIAAIGYCFGGQCVLELARAGADVKAVVSYHGLLTTNRPAQRETLKAQVVAYNGALDPNAPPAHTAQFRQEMIDAAAKWHITEFGNSYHGFTDVDSGCLPLPGIAYDPLADAISWAGTLALLKTLL